MKMVLLIACVGHVLCGICDCLLGYSPSGRLDLKSALKDPVKMRTTFEDMPLKWPLISIILGVYAITAFGFGYLGLSRWMEDYSKIASVIMYISAVFLYVRMGRTDEARTVALEFQMKTIATMFVGYLGLVIYVITLFVMVVMGRTTLPVWTCIFNTLPLMLLLSITKLPAKGNIAGAIMYLGLFIFL